MATIKRIGFGQVEPNHLSAQGNRQIYAQLPLDNSINILENGQFMVYNYAEGKVTKPAAEGMEPMLVYNEVKCYDERDSYKDFAMIKENYVAGEIYPRLFKTNVGDIFTTNCFEANTDKNKETTGVELEEKDKLKVNTDGYLEKDAEGTAPMLWQVIKIYTMPDGQQGVKIQRIK